MSRAPRSKRSRIYTIAASVLLLNALICLNTLSVLNREVEQSARSRQRLAGISQVEASIKDAEIEGRKLQINPDKSSLPLVREKVEAVFERLDRLQALAAGDDLMQTRVASLRHVFQLDSDSILFDCERALDQGHAPTVAVPESENVALHNHHERERLFSELQREEDRKLKQTVAKAGRAQKLAAVAILFASTLALTLLGLVFFLNRREASRSEIAAVAIREREEWFSATLASISDAVIATDEAGRVRLINPVAQALTGWSHSESRGRPLEQVFPLVCEDTRAPVSNPVARVLNEGVSLGFSNHTLLVARDGTEHPVEHCGAPIRRSDGAVAGVVLCFRDVGEQRRAEAELRASKELADNANRAKDQFLAVLSHELRKPLTPVMVAVSSLLEDQAFETIHPTLEMVRRNVAMESRLIDDLLDVSRIARGGLRLHMELVDVHEAIRHAVMMCHAETLLANVDVSLELDAVSSYALADETRLMQVVWNLVTNAAKFTPGGGKLEIASWNKERPAPGPIKKQLIVEFRDSGIGIDPSEIDRIFEPFERGSSSTSRHPGGLGLGLAISRGIVQAHGGRLSVHSEGRGHGTTFRLELSLTATPVEGSRPVPAVEGPRARPQASLERPKGLKILVVEDNPDTLRFLGHVLTRRGHQVQTAARIETARTLLASPDFDLLISDIELPDGTGLELARENRGLPAIALSGFGSDDDLRQSELAGFARHLTKPVDLQTLDEAIRQVVSREKQPV